MAKQPIGQCTRLDLNPVDGTPKPIDWDDRAHMVQVLALGPEPVVYSTAENPETSPLYMIIRVGEEIYLESADQAIAFRCTSSTNAVTAIAYQQFQA